MATFSIKILNGLEINNGNEYQDGDYLQYSAINNLVEGVLYANYKYANIDKDTAVITALTTKILESLPNAEEEEF